ncbi:MAG: cyclophilin-like fold protein [Coriobacteriia bacterium]|nr:cyclophilin-like fold protein [Coriobacteriia bacterium]
MSIVALCLVFSIMLAGCSAGADGSSQSAAQSAAASEQNAGTQQDTEEAQANEEAETVLQMAIGETPVEVAWEDNESVEALKDLCQDGPLTIEMSMYGGFEQVGSIGQSLPRADVQMTTQAGDIVLYSGNQMVVFYGSNSWSYTKLGRIGGKSAQELVELLGNGDVTITIERV